MSTSISAYARHRKAAGLTGGTPKAVRDRRDRGVLDGALTKDRKAIADVELADRLWAACTNPDMVPSSGPTSPVGTSTLAPSPLAEHRARAAAASATLVELELEEKRGALVRVEDVEAKWADIVAVFRTKLLGVPARARVRDPSLSGKQVTLIDNLIRESLEELADEAWG